MFRHADRFAVDDFETQSSLTTSSSGGPVATTYPRAREDTLRQSSYTFYHVTNGAMGAWPGGSGGGSYMAGLPNSSFDATAWTQLSVKFAQRWDAPFNMVDQDQDVNLTLQDADGDRATLLLSDYGRIPWPVTHNGTWIQNFPKKTVLRTTHLPLADFVTANPALNLTRLANLA